jgi:hypothetical protein
MDEKKALYSTWKAAKGADWERVIEYDAARMSESDDEKAARLEMNKLAAKERKAAAKAAEEAAAKAAAKAAKKEKKAAKKAKKAADEAKSSDDE